MNLTSKKYITSYTGLWFIHGLWVVLLEATEKDLAMLNLKGGRLQTCQKSWTKKFMLGICPSLLLLAHPA